MLPAFSSTKFIYFLLTILSAYFIFSLLNETQESPISQNTGKMKSWEVNSFTTPSSSALQLNPSASLPSIQNPTDVLIKVVASSVNPIDLYMARGYGAKLFEILREKEKGRGLFSILFGESRQFPVRLGRDFSGIVESIGSQVSGFKVGDPVYGVVSIQRPGSFAEYVVVHQDWIQKKPEFLSFTDATAIPYVAMTAWSALRNAGNFVDFIGKTFLVLGGSGGVGTFVVQYLKSQGAKVTTTCSGDAIPMLKKLGADVVINYRDAELDNLIGANGPYDCILDLTGYESDGKKYLEYSKKGIYITLTSPAMLNMDSYGLILGALKTGYDLISLNLGSYYNHGASVKWGFFTPDGAGWKAVANLVADKKIKPIVDKVYKFQELPQAYEKVEKGHLRGKIVVEY